MDLIQQHTNSYFLFFIFYLTGNGQERCIAWPFTDGGNRWYLQNMYIGIALCHPPKLRLICGLIFATESIELLQQYLDRTDDLQTVCLVCTYCLRLPPHPCLEQSKHTITDIRLKHWFVLVYLCNFVPLLLGERCFLRRVAFLFIYFGLSFYIYISFCFGLLLRLFSDGVLEMRENFEIFMH